MCVKQVGTFVKQVGTYIVRASKMVGVCIDNTKNNQYSY